MTDMDEYLVGPATGLARELMSGIAAAATRFSDGLLEMGLCTETANKFLETFTDEVRRLSDQLEIVYE